MSWELILVFIDFRYLQVFKHEVEIHEAQNSSDHKYCVSMLRQKTIFYARLVILAFFFCNIKYQNTKYQIHIQIDSNQNLDSAFVPATFYIVRTTP